MPRAKITPKTPHEKRQTLRSAKKAARLGKTLKGSKAGINTVKDPNAPQRPQAPLMFFLIEWQDRITQEYPNASIGEQTRLVSTKWKALDSEAKKVYTRKSEQDVKRFKEEKMIYDAKFGLAAPTENISSQAQEGSSSLPAITTP